MDLNQLIVLSTVPTTVVPKTIKVHRPLTSPQEDWDDPNVPEFNGEFSADTVDIHIRKYSGADQIEFASASDRERVFVGIHRCVVHRDGSPVFETREQAMSLSSWLVVPLFNAVSEVNDNRPKASRRRTSSGSKSPSPSAGARRKSGSTP